MGPGLLGNYYFGHTDVMVHDKVGIYDPHVVGSFLLDALPDRKSIKNDLS